MSDNLKLLKERIETDIDPSGAPGSILAENHQEILFDVLNKVGRHTGFGFTANKVVTVFPDGTMSWESNSMNTTTSFDIIVSKLTSDLNDFGLVLSKLNTGDILKFKDFVGRSVILEYQSHTSGQDGSANDIYTITVQGKAENVNYTYQDNEVELCVFEAINTGGSGGGSGLPNGGTTGQILAKIDNTDGNVEWIDAPADGQDGAPGADGSDGADGLSAYQIAVNEGFVGDETAWLASLVGADGADGTNGSDGADGVDGVGVPAGGTTGQVLEKVDNTDFNTQWADPAGGSSGYEDRYIVTDYGAVGDGVTDDTGAIQSAIQACFDGGGGVVYFPNGIYFIDGAKDVQSDSQLYFPLSSFNNTSDLKTVVLRGQTPPNMYTNPFNAGVGSIENVQNGVILKSNMLSTGNVIGSRSEAVTWGDFNFLQAHIENISVRVRSMTGSTHVQPLATAINMGDVYNFTAKFVEVACTSPMPLQLEPATSVYGVVMPKRDNWTLCALDKIAVRGMYIGVDLYEHSQLDGFIVDACVIGLNFNTVNHSIHVNKGVVARCRYNLQFGNNSYFKIDHISFEDDYTGHVGSPSWNGTVYDINDLNQNSKGTIFYHVVSAGSGVDYDVFTRNVPNDDIKTYRLFDELNNSVQVSEGISMDNLLAYWKFEESTGDILDSSGNGLDATRVNNPSITSGKINNALLLDSSNEEYLNAGSSGLSFGNNALTITGWFKRVDTGQAFETLFNKGDATEREYNCYYTQSTGLITFVVYNGTASAGLVSISAPTNNTYFFLKCEITDTEISISVNNGTPVSTSRGGTITAPSSKDLIIGSDGLTGSAFNGEIDELSIWNRILSTEDVAFLYNNGSGNEIVEAQNTNEVEVIEIACSDLTTAITTGFAGFVNIPFDFEITEIRGILFDAGDTNGCTWDVNVNGSTILSTKLTTDSTEETSDTATTPAVLTSTTLSKGDKVTVDHDVVPNNALGSSVQLIGYRL